MSTVTKIKPAADDRPEQPTAEERPSRGRRFRRVALMLIVPLALALGAGWVWLSGGRYQETENAYLHQARVSVASDLSGRVTKSR